MCRRRKNGKKQISLHDYVGRACLELENFDAFRAIWESMLSSRSYSLEKNKENALVYQKISLSLQIGFFDCLAKLWDKDDNTIGFYSIENKINIEEHIKAAPSTVAQFSLKIKFKEIIDIINEYYNQKGSQRYNDLRDLVVTRNNLISHHSNKFPIETLFEKDVDQIDRIAGDSRKIIGFLIELSGDNDGLDKLFPLYRRISHDFWSTH